jgi:ectoine hydroxylase-related dioxygenase (phytanoyl-CoA dioxygenase family)
MLSTEQQDFYRDNGYVVASGVFSADELDALEAEFDGVVARRSQTGADLDATWGGDWKKDSPAMTIVHTHDVQKYSAAWGRVLFHERFTGMLADIIGPNVQLHHTKLFQKPTETGGAFPLHQDYHYFPHANETMMAAVIHLTDATEEMGCIRVVPGSHKGGVLETYKSPSGKNPSLFLDPKRYPVESAMPLTAKRGDVVCFSYLTIHGSAINSSNHVRKTVLVQARDPEDKPLSDAHTASHAQGMMLCGVDPLSGATA